MKTKNLIKPIISAILSVSLSCTALTLSVSASSTEFKIDKLDSGLQNYLVTADANEEINVSVWVNDIDYNDVKSDVEEALQDEVQSGEISSEAIDCVFTNEETLSTEVLYTDFINNNTDISTNEINEVIMEQREITSDKITQNNNYIYNKICEELGNTKPEIIMMSSYAPTFDLKLTKEQIYKLTLSEYIEDIYYLDTTATFTECADSVSEEDDEDEEITYDTTYFDVTGLSTGRDVYGLTGTGMKVGMIEAEYSPQINSLYFDNTSNLTNVRTNISLGEVHGTQVATIIVGKKGNFTGAVPDAHLYCSILGGIEVREAVISELLDCGVTAINMSCSMIDPYNNYNTYGTLSNYIDYISTNYNVTFIMSSGNTQDMGIRASNMSYNAIIVGNCNNLGNLEVDSSYNLSKNKAYKPDLVAPGDGIDTSAGSMTGTSASAPMVTSAVIQLTQAIPALTGKSALIKSILMSSSTITNYMNLNDVITPSTYTANYISLSKEYGAGMLNLTNAYNSAYVNNYYHSGIFTPPAVAAVKHIELTNVTGKKLRFTATWDKINTATESIRLDSFDLEIKTPSGTKYTSSYLFDNKQMVSFEATENGNYTITLIRNYYSSSNQNINYALSYSIQ